MAEPDAQCTSQAGDDILRPYLSLDAPRLVLDLRPDAAFHREHLVQSYHIAPVSELKSRYSYLPPRNVPFLVLADALQRDDVIEAFATISSARIVLLVMNVSMTKVRLHQVGYGFVARPHSSTPLDS